MNENDLYDDMTHLRDKVTSIYNINLKVCCKDIQLHLKHLINRVREILNNNWKLMLILLHKNILKL